MTQIEQRDFMMRVLLTLGLDQLMNATGFSKESIISLCTGSIVITKNHLDFFFCALNESEDK